MREIYVSDETIIRLSYARHQLDVPSSADYSTVIEAVLSTSEVETELSKIATDTAMGHISEDFTVGIRERDRS